MMGDREQVPRGGHMHHDGLDHSNARVSTLHRDVGRYRVQHGVVLRDRDLRAPRRSHYELGGRMG